MHPVSDTGAGAGKRNWCTDIFLFKMVNHEKETGGKDEGEGNAAGGERKKRKSV